MSLHVTIVDWGRELSKASDRVMNVRGGEEKLSDHAMRLGHLAAILRQNYGSQARSVRAFDLKTVSEVVDV